MSRSRRITKTSARRAGRGKREGAAGATGSATDPACHPARRLRVRERASNGVPQGFRRQWRCSVNQLESTLEVLKDRSGDAVEAVQHGVEALGTRLGVIEPPRRRRRAPWLLVALVAVVAGVVWWQARSRRATADAEFEQVTGSMPSSRSA